MILCYFNIPFIALLKNFDGFGDFKILKYMKKALSKRAAF